MDIEQLKLILEMVQNVADGAIIVAVLWLVLQALPYALSALTTIVVVWLLVRTVQVCIGKVQQFWADRKAVLDFDGQVAAEVKKQLKQAENASVQWRNACDEYLVRNKKHLFIQTSEFDTAKFRAFIRHVEEIAKQRDKEISQ